MSNLAELKKTFVVYFIDIDPDTGFVSQMKPIAYTELEAYAKFFTELLNSSEDEEPTRTHYFRELK